MSLRGFLFRHFLWIIPLSDNRVVGSGSLGRIAHFMSPSLGSVRKLCWTGYFGLPISDLLGLPNLDLGRWCAIVSRCSCQLTCIPITALVAPTVSLGFILAPPPYGLVNERFCESKKKKKKNIGHSLENFRVLKKQTHEPKPKNQNGYQNQSTNNNIGGGQRGKKHGQGKISTDGKDWAVELEGIPEDIIA